MCAKAIRRVKERDPGDADRAMKLVEIEQFVVKARDRTFFIPFADVDWIEAARKYVRVHTGNAAHLVRQSITDVEHRLDARRFLRIHRGTIVNVKRIAELNRGFGGGMFVVLRDGTRLTMSRRFRTQIREMTGLDV